MARVKFDKEKASILITELTTLKSNIDTCLDNINGCGTNKNNRDADMAVMVTKSYIEQSVDENGNTVKETKYYQATTYPNDAKVANYNDALSSIQEKANALKTTSARINKVITALTSVSTLVDDFENTTGLTLSAELGDAADHNFNFLNAYGSTGAAGLKGHLGYFASIFDKIDITEFNRLGEDIIPTEDGEIPEKVIDFDGDGKISITDYLKSYLSTNVNEEGKVVLEDNDLGPLDELSLSSILSSNINIPEFIENLEHGIEEDLHVIVDLTAHVVTLAGENNPDIEDSLGIAAGALLNTGVTGLEIFGGSEERDEELLKYYMSTLDEEQLRRFEEETAGMSDAEKLMVMNKYTLETLQHLGKNPEIMLPDSKNPVLTTEPLETDDLEAEESGVVDQLNDLAGASASVGATLGGVAAEAGKSNVNLIKTEDKVFNDNHGTPPPNNNGYGGQGNGSYGDGGHNDGGGHGDGGHKGEHRDDTVHHHAEMPATEVPTQPQTEAPIQPKTEAPTQPKTEPKVDTPKPDDKPRLEPHSRGDDNDFELPTLKNGSDVSVEEVIDSDEKTTASSALLGAAGIGAGSLLGSGGNATPSIPNVDLGVSTPTLTSPSVSAPTANSAPTTMQNGGANTNMPSAAVPVNEAVPQQDATTQQNNSTHSTRTTADTSSQGLSKGKSNNYQGSSSSSSSSSTNANDKNDDSNNQKTENKIDTSKPEGVLGEASYAEMIAKEEKQIKIATAITASSMAVSIALSFASIIDVVVLVLLLLAMALFLSTFVSKKKKKIKKLEALIRIEKIKKEETDDAVKEDAEIIENTDDSESESSEDKVEETMKNEEKETETESEETKNKQDASKIKEVEEIVSEKKEFQSAEEVIYGEMPHRDDEDIEQEETSETEK